MITQWMIIRKFRFKYILLSVIFRKEGIKGEYLHKRWGGASAIPDGICRVLFMKHSLNEHHPKYKLKFKQNECLQYEPI